MPSWSQKIEAKNFPADFCTRDILGRGEPVCRHSIFVHGHQSRQEIIWTARNKFQNFSEDWHLWRFWSAFRHFGTHFAESFRMSKFSWMMDPTRSRDMPSCSATDLAEIRRSSKISSWMCSIISGMFTVLDRPGRGASITGGKITRLNWGSQFLLVAYDGACSPNVSVRMAWISFGALPCRGKKTWWQLASRCCWNRARRVTCFLSASVTRKDLQFGTWTDPSFLRHREVGRTEDLSAPPRNNVANL